MIILAVSNSLKANNLSLTQQRQNICLDFLHRGEVKLVPYKLGLLRGASGWLQDPPSLFGLAPKTKRSHETYRYFTHGPPGPYDVFTAFRRAYPKDMALSHCVVTIHNTIYLFTRVNLMSIPLKQQCLEIVFDLIAQTCAKFLQDLVKSISKTFHIHSYLTNSPPPAKKVLFGPF